MNLHMLVQAIIKYKYVVEIKFSMRQLVTTSLMILPQITNNDDDITILLL